MARSGSTPKFLSTEEIEALFTVIRSPRDRAIFRLAYHRGLRASELGLLQFTDYRPGAGRLYVHRLKGSNSGEFRLTHAEQTALRAWIRERGSEPGPLFPSRNHRAISRKRLHALMRRYCLAAGVPIGKAHMHSLKHSCGTHLSEMEPDITAIQDHLGHKNIQNTMVYVAITNQKRDALADRLKDWGGRRAA